MKFFPIVFLLSFCCLKTTAQKNQDNTEFKVYVDSIVTNDTVVEKNERFTSKNIFVHFQLINHTKGNLMIQQDTYSIYTGNLIDYEVEAYSNDLKKFIGFKAPEDKIEEIREFNLQPLKPAETLTRKGEVYLYTPLNKRCRIRLIFMLSRDNQNVKDVRSNWITL